MAGPTRSATNWSTGVAHVAYDSASNPGFIPEIWSGKLRQNFYPTTVFGDIANTDHEGEIKGYGDNVVIRTIPAVTVDDYEIGEALTYEQPASDKVELSINKAKKFTFQCDSIDRYQSDIDLIGAWSVDAGERMKVSIDTSVLGAIYADADAANAGATAGAISGDIDLGVTAADGSGAVQLTSSTIVEYIINHGLVLDEQNCPSEGRWIVLPAWACARIKTSELKDASLSGDGTSMLRNGMIGMIDRFKVFSSNHIAHATETATEVFHIMAGHKSGVTFASQMTNMESLPNPWSFGHLVRGLNVYGFKVTDGTLLTHGVVKK